MKLTRDIIGFITSGGYSLSKGYGIGIATITKQYIDSDHVFPWVWIRNIDGKEYFKAKIIRTFSG